MKLLLSLAVALAVLADGISHKAAGSVGRQAFSRHWTARDQQVGRYQYVPFDVPQGTTQIAVQYRYNQDDGANVVDLGIFEPGPLTIGTSAFRGWSGGARDRITIGLDRATPGYWPGPIPAGRWHAALGLYKVGPAGVDVEVIVETSSAPAGAAPDLPARPPEPLRKDPAWYVGSLHTHTVHSDGELTTRQLIDRAAAERLEFVAITDHNNTTHQLDAIPSAGVVVISGEEVTTPGGHFGVLGLKGAREYVDFRILPGDPGISHVMQAARSRGAVIAVNHPVDDCLACSWTHPIPDAVNAIEIANGDASARQQAIAVWDALLRSGRRITAIGESDWHRGSSPIGMPAVRVRADELSSRSILDAIAAGRVIVMASGALPPPGVVVRAGDQQVGIGGQLRVAPGEPVQVEIDLTSPPYAGGRVDLHWNGEAVATATVPSSGRVLFGRYPTFRGYLRVHVSSAKGEPLAVTNPVFVEIGS